MSNDQLTIGGLAKACGVNVESIRYYHRDRLVADPSTRFEEYPTL